MNVDLRAIGRKVLHEFGLRAERLLAMMWISRPRDWEAITWAKLEEVVLSRRQRELKGELLSHGYMYMSIQWNKVVTDLFGAKVPNDGLAHNRLCFGTIERGSDAWEIMRDAGRFLKNPTLTGLPAGANQRLWGSHRHRLLANGCAGQLLCNLLVIGPRCAALIPCAK